MNISWLSWVAAVIIFSANFILIKSKSWKVFIIFILGNSMYAYYWFVEKQWATFILVSFFIIQNIYGLIQWRKEQTKKIHKFNEKDYIHWLKQFEEDIQ
jgi:hypothetical protein